MTENVSRNEHEAQGKRIDRIEDRLDKLLFLMIGSLITNLGALAIGVIIVAAGSPEEAYEATRTAIENSWWLP